MFYFGPWDKPGHYLFDERGRWQIDHPQGFPWSAWSGIDGCLQPGCRQVRDRWEHSGPQNEGQALLHHKDGWTALSFWDRSVDRRGACNSNYFAEGYFTFDEMVEMARTRFAVRWNRMKFQVVAVWG